MSKGIAVGVIAWIAVGLIAGSLAKLLMPRSDAGGWILTILLGIVGAFVVGYLWTFVSKSRVSEWSVASTSIAVIGALAVLAVYRLVVARR